MTVGSPQTIGPTPAQPPKYGLLVAADVTEAEMVAAAGSEQATPREWFQGVTWSPEQFHGGGVVGVDCHGASPDGKDAGDNPVANVAEPFVVFAVDQCSTFGFEGRDTDGRARRQLIATQSYHIAKEFQLGTQRDAQGLDNVALEDAVEIGPSPTTPINALAELEGAISDRFAGARAMIHMTPQTMTLLTGAGPAIVQSGQKWLTAFGSIIVADAGYQAVAGHEWMYATGIVRVRLGGIDVLGDVSQRVDRATNLETTIAERLALVQVDATDQDPADSMFKVEVNITPWLITS